MLKKLLAVLRFYVKSKSVSQPESPSPFSDPTPVELEMILDATNLAEKGRPHARPSAQGIADMQARIDFLNSQIRQIEEQAKKSDEKFKSFAATVLTDLNRDLIEAQDRLREYQTRLQRLN